MAASIQGMRIQMCSLCSKRYLLKSKSFPIAILLRRCVSKKASGIVAGQTDIDPVVLNMLKDRKIGAFKQHSGVMTLPTVHIPVRLKAAILIATEKYPVSNLQDKSNKLHKYLHSRALPTESRVLQQNAVEFRKKIIDDENINLSGLTSEDWETEDAKIQKKVLAKLRHSTYHWVPIKYDAKTAVLYLHARMAEDYSEVLQCLSEISRREKDYVPRTVFDFGSGLATSVWACNTIWGSKILEYYCVDTSRDMNTLARILLQDGEEYKEAHIPGVYFRQFMPSSEQNSFSLVICGHSLLDLESSDARLSMVSALWRMTEDFLVLVDTGSIAGFNVINEAKEFILRTEDTAEGHVFAPCPHDSPCGKLLERNSPCMFSVMYRSIQPSLVKNQHSRYSYVVLKKGKRNSEDVAWPRIIQEITKGARHVHCHLCLSDGSISHEIFTSKKNGRNMYQCCKASKWGDLFPVQTEGDNSNESVDRLSSEQPEQDTASVHCTETPEQNDVLQENKHEDNNVACNKEQINPS